MDDYGIIAEAGGALVRLLKKELVPELIKTSSAIGLASPDNRDDRILCIHLYDVNESEIYRASGMISDGADRQIYPPVYLTLSYMITAFSSGDAKFRSEEEQRILGRVVQVLRDHPTLNPDTMEFDMGGGGNLIRLEMLKTDQEERSRIWSFPNLAPKLSLFYRLGPVALASARTKEIKRVREMEFKKDVTVRPWAKLFRRDR